MARAYACRWMETDRFHHDPGAVAMGHQPRDGAVVNELASLIQMSVAVVAVVLPIVIAIRFLAGADHGNSILMYVEPSWPRGVQEEDPQPWRFAPVG